MGRPSKVVLPAPPQRRSRRQVIVAVLIAVVVVGGWLVTRTLDGDEAQPTPHEAPGPTPVGEWPPEVLFIPNTVPAMIKDEIAMPGQRQGYQFDGRAGQVWAIAAEVQPDGTLDPLLSLYGPSGALLSSSDDRSAEDLSAELTVTLPQNGAYRVVVESSAGGITTGAYLLTLGVQR